VSTLRKAITAALASTEAKSAAMKVASFDYDFIDGEAAEKELAGLRDELRKAPEAHKLLLRLMSPHK
ncbi:MAG: hypothetical protein NWT00_07070, partial [Beijerinckiaceae bacterium]|nr:hypothetical protein [Beijerinckiaceae bacterium]